MKIKLATFTFPCKHFIVGLLNSLVNSLKALIIYVVFIIIISCFLWRSIFQLLTRRRNRQQFVLLCLSAEPTTDGKSGNCMLGNNRIAGLFTYYLSISPWLSAAIIGFAINKPLGKNASHLCSVTRAQHQRDYDSRLRQTSNVRFRLRISLDRKYSEKENKQIKSFQLK